MAVRPFTDTLTSLRRGALLDEVSDKLNELVNACKDTGKVGTLTLVLKIKPSKGRAMEIFDEVKTKTPERERDSTLMFPTVEGNLQRDDPDQLPIAGLRSVDAETGELRRVAVS